MDQKRCRKCKKILPTDYRYHCCEYCRNKKIDNFKKVGAGAIAIIGVALTGKRFSDKK